MRSAVAPLNRHTSRGQPCLLPFLGYSLREGTLHLSTIGYNFRHRFKKSTAERIFICVLAKNTNAGYLFTDAVFIDGTHIKASANRNKTVEAEVPVEAKRYAKELMREVNTDWEKHGKTPLARTKTDRNRGIQAPTLQKRSWHAGRKNLKKSRKARPTRTAGCS